MMGLLKRLRPFLWPAALLLVALVIGLLRGPVGPQKSFDLGSPDAGGARALALYLAGSGWRVTNELEDPSALTPADSVLLMTLETLAQLDPVSSRQLAGWVRSGGRLVVLGEADGESDFEFAPPPPVATGAQPGEIELSSLNGPLSGVRRVVTGSDLRWYVAGEAFDSWETALSNLDGALVIRRREAGAGEVLALSDPSPLTNEHLRDADDLALALDLVADGRRHQLGLYTLDPMALLRRALTGEAPAPLPLSWRLLPWGLALAAVLGFWLMGRRTGPVLPLEAAPARPATEFLEAQAHAYRRAQAHTAVLRYVLAAFRREATRRAGLPPQVPAATLAAAAPRLGLPQAALQELLERAEQALAGPLAEKQMLTLVRDLVVMQRRMGRAHH